MKIWPLLIAVLLPLHGYATVNDDNENDSGDGYAETDEEEFEGFYDDEDFVSISTGTKKSLAKAPSVASVITAKKIKQMGFRTLGEVLAVVPGLHVSNSSELMAPKYLIRGVVSQFNAQTLVLVNGTPISSVVRGDRHAVWGAFPVNAIARIEVIRGPGSALHGADAFAGVINIITKTFDDIDKTEMGVRFGSFNSKEIWALSALELGDFKIAVSAEIMDTDGYDGTVDADAQTRWDGIFGTTASLAPGGVNKDYEGYDLRTDIAYKDLTLKVGYQNRDKVGTGNGVGRALDPRGKVASDKVMINLNYISQLSDNWHADLRLSNYRSNQTIQTFQNIFPPGAFGGAYPSGYSGNPYWWEKNQIAKGHFTYSGFAKHTITFGGGYRKEDLYRVVAKNNIGGAAGELPEFQTFTHEDTDSIYMPKVNRHDEFAFFQDEVQIAPDWELTFGLRYDNYSDFGSTINPRLALVWATDRNLSTKFLYGRAFRAPNFGEIYAKNNDFTKGNSEIKAEEIDTYEIAFNYQLSQQVHIDLNLYHLVIKDSIDFVPFINTNTGGTNAQAQNVGKLKGNGMELELNYKISDTLNLLANYAYQKTEDQTLNDDLGGAPSHQIYAQLNWNVNESISINSEVRYIGEQARSSLENSLADTLPNPRPATSAYTSFALGLNYDDIFEGINLQVKINNAFDEDIREPSLGPSNTSSIINIPGDLPQAGRALFVGLQKTF
jgi:outer membrane receptor for ferrienterochelin and colicin